MVTIKAEVFSTELLCLGRKLTGGIIISSIWMWQALVLDEM